MTKRRAPNQPITRADLARSIVDCHKIEDAMWSQLRDAGCDERSGPTSIAVALTPIRQRCPAWCTGEAWERYADSFCEWSQAHGSLQVFWRLRRKKGDDR